MHPTEHLWALVGMWIKFLSTIIDNIYNANTNRSLTTSDCHAGNSQQYTAAQCVGLASCSISVTNAIFSDPCGGTAKYFQASVSCDFSGI